MEVKKFIFNPIQENTFILYDETGECVIIDPGCYFDYEKAELEKFISQKKLNPVRLINTHCHFDHVLGVNHCCSVYDLKFEAHQDETSLLNAFVVQSEMFGVPADPVKMVDAFFKEDDIICFGNSKLRVIEAPGHSPGGVVFYSEKENLLIAGDVLFYGSIGRSDLPGGNYERLVRNIKTKLLVLPEHTKIYCGHGQETTIGFEKMHNPFLMD